MPVQGVRPRGRRWWLQNPSIIWPIVLLAMAPSLYGFGHAGLPAFRTGSAAAGKVSGAIEVTDGVKGRAAVGQTSSKDSSFAPGLWLQDRVKEGKARMRVQVMSMMTHDKGVDTNAKQFENAPVDTSERVFLINGWRWHTLAVLRDVKRFRRVILLAAQYNPGGGRGGVNRAVDRAAMRRVLKCYGFMWTFSFRKLHKVESGLFFPWLREHLPEEVLSSLDEFSREKEAVIRIGDSIGKLLKKGEQRGDVSAVSRSSLLKAADLSLELEKRAGRLARAQESVVVPYVGAYMDSKLQEKFNDKVIRSLGLVDSQVLLVSMYDALTSDVTNGEEYKGFKAQIPGFAQALIPTWRRVLYSPRAGCLDEAADTAYLQQDGKVQL
ncbi:unnamed protein product [Choristocarpus tenellus]